MDSPSPRRLSRGRGMFADKKCVFECILDAGKSQVVFGIYRDQQFCVAHAFPGDLFDTSDVSERRLRPRSVAHRPFAMEFRILCSGSTTQLAMNLHDHERSFPLPGSRD
jgi:hypothetical protein